MGASPQARAIPRIAVIPTLDRPVLRQSVAAIRPQVDAVFIINNGPTGWSGLADGQSVFERLVTPADPVNLSKLWNLGLNEAIMFVGFFTKKWDVAILNDDAIVPEGWFDAVSTKMREMRAAAACSGGVTMPVLHTHPGPVPLETRLQGFAFMVAGELGLRANEDLYWYFTDDWMDWESRKIGGMVMVPGFPVQHLYPNQQVTQEMQAQIARDAQTFVEIYGMRPW